MPVDLLLTNAQVVTDEAVFSGGVAVQDGKIADVVEGDAMIAAREVVDLGGKLLLPGLVDAHVHFNQPGRDHWEGYRTGSMAAAAGGVTTVLDMPLNATPPTTNAAMLALKRDAVRSESVVDYGHWGGLVDDNVSDLPGLIAGGVVGCKAFMSSSGVDFERVDDDVLFAGLEVAGELGSVIGVHAENEYVTALLGQRLRASGRTDRASWYESRPPATELEAIRRACHWAKAAGGSLHVVHVTIAEGLEEIARAKREGTRVTAETCPHYLFFDQSDFERIGPLAKCAPPLRSRDDVDALWSAVLAGLVDTIGSDHSPCTWEEKERGLDEHLGGLGRDLRHPDDAARAADRGSAPAGPRAAGPRPDGGVEPRPAVRPPRRRERSGPERTPISSSSIRNGSGRWRRTTSSTGTGRARTSAAPSRAASSARSCAARPSTSTARSGSSPDSGSCCAGAATGTAAPTATTSLRDRDLEDRRARPAGVAAAEGGAGIREVDDRALTDVDQGHVRRAEEPIRMRRDRSDDAARRDLQQLVRVESRHVDVAGAIVEHHVVEEDAGSLT